jgi:hypothetical protein
VQDLSVSGNPAPSGKPVQPVSVHHVPGQYVEVSIFATRTVTDLFVLQIEAVTLPGAAGMFV